MASPSPGQLAVERFAALAQPHLDRDCLVLCLLPWCSSDEPPGNILVPRTLGGSVSEQEIHRLAATRHTVLVPCTFETPEEEASAHRILPLFTACDHICVFIVHILPEDPAPNKQNSNLIMRRHDAMLATGVDDVFMNPEAEPQALRRTINLARATWELNVQRMQLMLDAEPDPVSPELMRTLQAQHQRLMWESIPRALMPHFAPMDRNLVETGFSVGTYRLQRRFATNSGVVLQAVSEEGSTVAIKVIDKVKVCTPGELEGLYREFRFLCEIIKHPNITLCLGMLHSLARVYLLFEFAGNSNLVEALSSRPGQRFDEEEAMSVCQQVVRGIAFCHKHDVCHRNLSLHHVVLSSQPDSAGFICKVVDFHSAMVARGGTTSRTVSGSMPCMAPEVALGGPYVPRLADCWSVGIILLETAGGLCSLSRAIPYPVEADPRAVAPSIQHHFLREDGHREALAAVGAVDSRPVIKILQALLQPAPEHRSQLATLLEGKYGFESLKEVSGEASSKNS